MEFDQDKAMEWINSHWGSRSCPICSSKEWLLMTKIWKLTEFEETGKGTLPVVAMMCNTCGHTIFFNAIAMRLVERDE